MLAKLNNKMDSMAKRIALEYIHLNSIHQAKPTTLGIGTILCGGVLVTSRVQQSLYNRILHNKLVLWY